MIPSRPAIAALVSDVRCLARRDGLGPALRAVGAGIVDSVYARHDLLVLLKRLETIAPISFEPRMTIEELTPGGLPALARLNRDRCDTRADRRFAANLERRYHAFVAHAQGEPAGYHWWLDRRAEPHPHLERLGIELREGDVYGFDFFLAERYRGDGRAVEFLHNVETRLAEGGYARLWGYVSSANTPARWLYSMRGYEVVRTVHLRPGTMR